MDLSPCLCLCRIAAKAASLSLPALFVAAAVRGAAVPRKPMMAGSRSTRGPCNGESEALDRRQRRGADAGGVSIDRRRGRRRCRCLPARQARSARRLRAEAGLVPDERRLLAERGPIRAHPARRPHRGQRRCGGADQHRPVHVGRGHDGPRRTPGIHRRAALRQRGRDRGRHRRRSGRYRDSVARSTTR